DARLGPRGPRRAAQLHERLGERGLGGPHVLGPPRHALGRERRAVVQLHGRRALALSWERRREQRRLPRHALLRGHLPQRGVTRAAGLHLRHLRPEPAVGSIEAGVTVVFGRSARGPWSRSPRFRGWSECPTSALQPEDPNLFSLRGPRIIPSMADTFQNGRYLVLAVIGVSEA